MKYIITPSYTKTKNEHKYISQIKNKSFFLQNELSAYTALKECNCMNRYYIFDTIERMQYNELYKNLPSLEHSVTIQETDMYLVRYKKRIFYSIEDMLDYYTNNIQRIRFFINSYKFLLDSIDFLIQKNIIHNNIHPFTIKINKYGEPVIMKFDLSITDKLNIDHFSYYNPDYYYRPFELHVLSYLQMNKINTLSVFHMEKIIEEVVIKNTIINKFGEKTKILFETESRKYLTKLINKSFDFIVTEIWRHRTTWDNYGLSILYLQLLLNTFCISERFIQNIVKLLLVNIHSNPELRYSIHKTQMVLEEICYNLTPVECNKIKYIK